MMNSALIIKLGLEIIFVLLYVIERIIIAEVREKKGKGPIRGLLLYYYLPLLWNGTEKYSAKHQRKGAWRLKVDAAKEEVDYLISRGSDCLSGMIDKFDSKIDETTLALGLDKYLPEVEQ